MMSADDTFSLKEIQQTVQHNCAISDARYSREYSLCIYLLRLREFYRWQKNIPLGENIDPQALATWVQETETHWDEIEETEFRPLSLNGQSYDPFDTKAINKHLAGSGLLYTSGIGRLGQPHFLLAEEQTTRTIEQVTCVEFGVELARDSITLPAMAQDNSIYIRQECFSQLLWQMVDEWSLNKAPGPMARLVDHYQLDINDGLEKYIHAAAQELSSVLLHHELGEIAASKLLGADYQEMTFAFHGKPGEMQLRAVKDLLADTTKTWPYIIKAESGCGGASPYLDFWLAGLTGFREKIFKQSSPCPSLFSDDPRARLNTLSSMIDTENSRWRDVAFQLLTHYRASGIHFNVDKIIQNMVELP